MQAVVFAILIIVVAGGLTWATTLLRRTNETVVRDTQSSVLASDIELTLLLYQRLSRLHLTSRDTSLRVTRETLAARIDSMLVDASALVGNTEERHLLERVRESWTAELAEWRRLETTTAADASDVLAHPAGSEGLARLDSLREMNAAQVRRAHSRAIRVDRLATMIAAGGGTLLIVALAGVVLALRRHVIAPILQLHDTVVRFQAGERTARAVESGSQESAELAGAVNRMLDAQVSQQERQLAFVAGVAHDLRHPLSGLTVGIEALGVRDGEAHRERTLAMLDRQVHHLARMIDDLLDAARIEAGRLELSLHRIDLVSLVEEAILRSRSLWPEYRIDARVKVAPGSPVHVLADALRLEQVLTNLISNAVKFSAPGSRIEVAVAQESEVAVLSVTDEGVGIPSEVLPELFQPFRRHHPEVAPGAGLGLSVVRRIVLAHEGTIDVHSTPGHGSTFFVRLPLMKTTGSLRTPRGKAPARPASA